MRTLALTFFATLAALAVSCKYPGRSEDSNQKATRSLPQNGEDEVTQGKYLEWCRNEVGEIPVFTCYDPAFQEIPVTNKGVSIESAKLDWGARPVECDKPTHLVRPGKGHCTPGSRIARYDVPSNPDSTYVVMCRRYNSRPPGSEHFEEVNLIGHNKRTGATCFLNSYVSGGTPTAAEPKGRDGRNIPPMELATDKVESYWMPPRRLRSLGNCLQCHSAGPWLHTPYVSQMSANGKSVVPPNPPKNVPYKTSFAHFKLGTDGQETDRLMNVEPCSTCHSIGRQEYCSTFAKAAIDNDWHSQKALSRYSKEQIAGALEKISECCFSPASEACHWQDFTKP